MNTPESINYLIEQMNKQGIVGDVIMDQSESLGLKAEKGSLSEQSFNKAKVLGIRVIKDGKVGISYSEDDRRESLDLALQMAVRQSKLMPEREGHEQEEVQGQNLDVTKLEKREFPNESIDISDKIKFLIDLEAKIKAKDKRVETCPYLGLSESKAGRFMASTKGQVLSEKSWHSNYYFSPLLNSGTDKSTDYAYDVAKTFTELVDTKNVDKRIEDILGYTGNLLDAKGVKTGLYDTIFNIEELNSLVSIFMSHFSGDYAKKGKSIFLKKDHPKFDSRLNFIDTNNHPLAFFSKQFDAEGFAKKETILLQNGEFKTYLHNSLTAKYFNAENTYNASRGPKSSLGVSSTYLTIGNGTDDLKTVESGEYFLVKGMMGLHSGANTVTGDFSFGASGYLMKDGQFVRAVKGVTVSGNFFEMMNKISAIANQAESNTSRNFFAPKIRFEKVSIAGDQ